LFAQWLSSEASTELLATTHTHIEAYLAYRYQQKGKRRKTAAGREQGAADQAKASSANRRLSVFKRFFRWAIRERHITQDPTLKLLNAKAPVRVPKTLTEHDVEQLLAAPEVASPLGLRDRTMLELMYASGLRVSECVGLKVHNVSLTEHVLRTFGKGSKERIVPFGEHAADWLAKYLQHGRPEILKGQQSDDLFVTARGSKAGEAMTRVAFWQIIKKYAQRAGITC
jgi:integrase/recombinase XerD